MHHVNDVIMLRNISYCLKRDIDGTKYDAYLTTQTQIPRKQNCRLSFRQCHMHLRLICHDIKFSYLQ